MKPFPHSAGLSIEQRNYNYCQPRRLKARWRHLLKSLDMDIDKIPTVVTACCILHNFMVIQLWSLC